MRGDFSETVIVFTHAGLGYADETLRPRRADHSM